MVCDKTVKTRNDLPEYLISLGLVGLGAEIGVWQGDFSAHILSRWPGKMILVDIWGDCEEYRNDPRNESIEEQERYYRITLGKMALFGDRVRIIREMSVDAAKHIDNNSLDFVYIDASHNYESVMADLEAWVPKVKFGGVIAGHDFFDSEDIHTGFGVKSAVTGYFGYSVAQTWETYPTWYTRKI